MSVLVLSAQHVADLVESLTASALANLIGRTMHAITKAAETPVEGVPPVQNPLRIATQYMPSRLTTSQNISMTAVKIVSVPDSQSPHAQVGLPGTTLLLDESTGQVKAMVNSSTLTGLRTASVKAAQLSKVRRADRCAFHSAASALATLILAAPTSQQLVVFGSGTQAYYHARLILELFPSINHASFIVRSPSSRSSELIEKLSRQFPTVKSQVLGTDKTSECVQQADIICCCVPSKAPIFEAKDLKANVHINASCVFFGSYMPSMHEFPPSLISPSTTPTPIPYILLDSRPACLSEAGELISAGIVPENCIELGQVVDVLGNPLTADACDLIARLKSGQDGKSLFKCVGVGGMDVGITALMVEMAEQLDVGVKLSFH
ncbi:BQ5605_C019g08965 [Microbotryum silenes-dioicae]|uniref:BQ5605_C019g08965 protein n=1 Tax=Microbotryum silenes-dioicae TaxID=796604 RepID=A0A2X0M073_9BASI|nr:BQ5605_C019g08965 [Microbotryum silenes-dioicae]